MFSDLAAVRGSCHVSPVEEKCLLSPEAPIVLLRRSADVNGCAEPIAPGNPYLGVVLPYTPLHHLLMSELGFPLVATSGNLSDEPICIDEHQALERLQGIADCFLVHNRPIVRQEDDSVIQVVNDRDMLLRHARGYAPLTLKVDRSCDPTLAVGGHHKNSIAVADRTRIIIGQHIGDLETRPAADAFERESQSLLALNDIAPERVAIDLHPDYYSTIYGNRQDIPAVSVQHHVAHLLACLLDNQLEPPVMGVIWDGTGLGTDGTIWGGEFILAENGKFERVARLRPFRLPGGEAAIREPRRSASGILADLLADNPAKASRIAELLSVSRGITTQWHTMLKRQINSPLTSSAGRLFDAVAALLNLIQYSSFEGEAAIRLQFAAEQSDCSEHYEFSVNRDSRPLIVDWRAVIHSIIADIDNVKVDDIARKFHNTLARMIVATGDLFEVQKVALSGGCFQNRLLCQLTLNELEKTGKGAFVHHRIPPNDGGIAAGQIMAATEYRDWRLT
jgi:hydrogenase maturation protein HypF